MASRSKVRITQDFFDAAVKENVDEFGMEEEEAIEDAVKTFTMQGVDLTGIVTTPGGACSSGCVHPAMEALELLEMAVGAYESCRSKRDMATRSTDADASGQNGTGTGDDGGGGGLIGRRSAGGNGDGETVGADGDSKGGLSKEGGADGDSKGGLSKEGGADGDSKGCLSKEGGADEGRHQRPAGDEVAKAMARVIDTGVSDDDEGKRVFEEKRGVAIFVNACDALFGCGTALAAKERETLDRGLELLASLLTDGRFQEQFSDVEGPSKTVKWLKKLCKEGEDDSDGLMRVTGVMSAAATAHERIKCELMDCKAGGLLLDVIRRDGVSRGALLGACEALRVLCIGDDTKAFVSKAYKHALGIGKAGGVEALLDASHPYMSDPCVLASLCSTLKAVAVNDELCKLVAEMGGISLIRKVLSDSVQKRNTVVTKNACALLCQLAGNDMNKDIIADDGGIDTLLGVLAAYSDQPSIPQQVFALISQLCLRSPKNASMAVQAGVADACAEAMVAHPDASGMQRQACMMLRNLAVRNPENRPIILERGLVKLVRSAMRRHSTSCKDVGSAALRDLGLHDYMVV